MRLRDYLQQHQITQAAFGQRMTPPVSQGKVNHWINGTRRVSLAEALQIEIVTGGAVSPRDLVTQELRPGDYRLSWPDLPAPAHATQEKEAADA